MIVVVGGGISGLATAFHLTRGGADVRLFEAGARLGGNLRTEEHDGFLYDVGPDGFLRAKQAGVELVRDLDLTPELIEPLPDASRVLVAYEGVLHAMPEGLSLGVPRRPLALLSTSLLSPAGKVRALLEPLVPTARGAREESIQEFLVRRVGDEVADRLVAPLLSGVFAGDPERLSMQAAFPQLAQYEARSGSLTAGTLGVQPGVWPLLRALWQNRRGALAARTPSAFVSLARGLGSLTTRLAERLPPGVITLRAPISALTASQEGIWVERADGERCLARQVVVAGPPWFAAPLLRRLDPTLASELAGVRATPTATVYFGFREQDVARKLDASGFIVPRGEAQILASTWVSSKWPGRAPPGHALVRAFVGGPRGAHLFERGDEELTALALAELRRWMGPLGRPLFSRVFRYERGSPQLELGHLSRMRAVSDRLAREPRLSLIGPGYDGVGIPDCARQARAVAEALLNGGPHSGVV